jgi:MSHA biogenesis protein MshP
MKFMSTTNPDRAMLIRRHQSGFSIATAIFLIVILAALGAFMVTIGSGQQVGLAQDVLGVRILQAARTGTEWGVYQVLNTTGSFRTSCNTGTATPVNLPALQDMAGITVKVECSSVAYTEGSSAFRSYQITATACNNATCPNTTSPPNLYVERRLTALVTN